MPETNRGGGARAAAALPIPATISIGVAAYPDDGTTGESLLIRAEAANALAKSRGKNQYAFIPDPPEPE